MIGFESVCPQINQSQMSLRKTKLMILLCFTLIPIQVLILCNGLESTAGAEFFIGVSPLNLSQLRFETSIQCRFESTQ